MNNQIKQIINGFKSEIRKISDNIYRNPEIGFAEHKACTWQLEFLKQQGFSIKCPAGEISTAYKAVYGKGTPIFCFMAEYDALPGKGHACGHNLIAASALAAGATVKQVLQKGNIPGGIIIMGCPAEEGKSGKIKLIKQSCFKEIEAALISHPYTKTLTETTWLGVLRYKVTFKGESSHASIAPQKGKNALDAANLLFSGVNAWRQYLPESSKVHGIITHGGDAPNIIPDIAGCVFYLRAENEKIREEMSNFFKDIVKGAALMTGTGYKCTVLGESSSANIYNKPLDNEFYKLAEEAGLNPQKSQMKGRGSSDFANVSQIVPCINLFYGITGDENFPLHSEKFKEVAGTDYAFEQTMKIAAIMARIALKYLKDEIFRDKVNTDFKSRKNESG
ncbi:MAG: M20 family metallopeptidase [Victivallaceae bacterium]|nr:M20 family metallopeptidase [Victivallaceae bacterium]